MGKKKTSSTRIAESLRTRSHAKKATTERRAKKRLVDLLRTFDGVADKGFWLRGAENG